MSEMGNALVNPQQDSPSSAPSGAQALSMPGAQQAGDVLKYMKAQMDQTAASVKKLQEAKGRATLVRRALDQLAALGDTVTQEDVTKESSKLVGGGMGAEEVAGLLADMPDGSQALQGWIGQHDVALRANEAKLDQMLATQRHTLGVQALHHVGAVSMVNHGLAAAPLAAPTQEQNELTGGPNG